MKSCARAALGVAATAAILGAAVIGCGSSHDHSDLLLPGHIRLDPPHQFASDPVVHDSGGKPPLAEAFEHRCV